MKKIIITVLALSLVLGGCLKTSEEKEAKEEVIKIGAPLALTGKVASFGEDIREGIAMAIDEVNQQRKIKIEIIYEDTQSEATQAVNAVKKLIEIDNDPKIKTNNDPFLSTKKPPKEAKTITLMVPVKITLLPIVATFT